MTPIYLDHHATTPCEPQVVQAMLPYFTEVFGNAASRGHSWGFEAQAAVDLGRERVAAMIGASPSEVIFTSGATEANNLAILGALARQAKRHVITTAIEHRSVLDPMRELERRGFSLTVLPVDRDGRVTPEQLKAALRADTALVSVGLANNEIGTLQPIAAIGEICREAGVWLHADAAQASGCISLDVAALNVDLLSLSAHKCYGPKGIGALFVRRRARVSIEPLQYGGGHEKGLRSGTLPVPLIVGFGVAAEHSAKEADSGGARLARLRDALWEGLAAIGGVHRNSPSIQVLPHNLNVAFDGIDAELLLLELREFGLSTGSACSSANREPSHVLTAIGAPPRQSVRFGLGRSTTEADIRRVIQRFAEVVPFVRDRDHL